MRTQNLFGFILLVQNLMCVICFTNLSLGGMTIPSYLSTLTHFPSTKTPSALSKQVLLPLLSLCLFDHFTGSSFAAPDSTTTRSIAPFVAPFIEQSGSSSRSSSSALCLALSPTALDMCVDLSSYSLP
jgi:hypothetical protein